MRYISADEANLRVPAAAAIALMEKLFLDDFDALQTPRRQVVDIPGTDGLTLFMPAVHAGAARMGIKVSSIRPHNDGMPMINGAYLLLDYRSGRPQCLIDSNAITRLRTAATTALVTRALLGRHPRQRLAILGAGAQALAHAEALCAAIDVESIAVLSRSTQRTRSFVNAVAHNAWAPPKLTPAQDLAELLQDATILCTCTSSASTDPLIMASDLPASLRHVNAIGGSTLEAIEIDPRLYQNGAVVESVDAACTDAGDLRAAIAQGWLAKAQLLTIGELLERERPETLGPTIYRSVGHAQEDLALAELIWNRSCGHA